jgi:hypothetical protein
MYNVNYPFLPIKNTKKIILQSEIKLSTGKAKIEPLEYVLWDFSEPTQETFIDNFYVGFDSGNVSVNFGNGFTSINNFESISISL